MKSMMCALFSALAVGAFAQAETPVPVKRVAVFVQNRTRVAVLDDEIDGIRDRLTAALSAVDGLELLDSSQVADSFRQYKVNADELKKGIVPGVFSGGSVPNVARMLGCDYIIAASVIGATSMKRDQGGTPSTVYTLRMTVKVMDSSGANVGHVPNWTSSFPVLNEGGDDPMNYYNILIDRWVNDTVNKVAVSAPKWRAPKAEAAALVSFRVTTSIDSVIGELESQTKGAKGEQLAELRKVVGGASVELDGAVLGTAPGEFKAAPGLHQLKITRQWMQTYAATINVQPGVEFNIALEMSEDGLAKWGKAEHIRADVAKRYGEAAKERGIKINIDTSNWRDGALGTDGVSRKVLIDN